MRAELNNLNFESWHLYQASDSAVRHPLVLPSFGCGKEIGIYDAPFPLPFSFLLFLHQQLSLLSSYISTDIQHVCLNIRSQRAPVDNTSTSHPLAQTLRRHL